MKKLMCLIFAVVSLVLVSAIYADDGLQSVLKNKPAATVVQQAEQETGWVVVPLLAGRRVYRTYRAVQVPKVEVVPVVPAVPLVVPPPLKPEFKTPLRDGVYYGTYYSRVYRYGRLGRLLNVPQVQIQQQ